jgi:FkbM family methyltransferase
MSTIYRIEDFRLHNQSAATLDDGLVLTTPCSQWHYAAELPLLHQPDVPMRIRIEITVSEGSVGAGSLRGDSNDFFHEIIISTSAEPVLVDVLTGAGYDAGSIIFRNTDEGNRPSKARIRIVDVTPLVAGEPILTPPEEIGPELAVDLSPLKPFQSWSGVVPAGFWTDWTGALTHSHVSVQGKKDQERQAQERFEDPGFPLVPEQLLDWLPLAQAVNAAEGVFRMAALGAGWGRWLVAGAFLARQVGKDYRLVAVEAEPQHFAWLNEHIDLNAIDRTRATLLQAAATGKPGDCWFNVGGDPQDWYGQSVSAVEGVHDGDFIEGPHGLLRRTPSITLTDLVEYETPLDYLHMDIQGAEAEFLTSAPHHLDAHVKMVNIGTHSLAIERNLRALFDGLGWSNVLDVELFSTRPLRINGQLTSPTKFGDGFQVWINPRFAAP